ncbi:MAG: sugar ABC transporter substrate-binding protein [Actinomycetota bacterium]|nr:sugar ABC transporter substrate-binding protein [Actinomycetota bacterium]
MSRTLTTLRRPAAALVALLMALAALTACSDAGANGDDDQVVIGFAVPVLSNPYWKANVDFAQDIAEQLDVELAVVDAGEKEDAQLKNIQDLISRGVDGIVFGPITAEVGPALLAACEQAGIPCAAMARKPSVEPDEGNADHYAGYVVADDHGDGVAAAQALADSGVTKAVAMSGLQGNSVADGRLDGFLEAAEELDIDVVSTYRPVELPEDGLSATKNFLAEHPGPGFDGVFAFNDSSALGAIEALEDAGAAGDVRVATIDGTADGVRAVEAGQLEITLGGEFVNGGFATVMVFDAINGNPWEERGVVLNVLPVTPDNAAAYRAKYVDTVPAYDAKQLSRTHNPDATLDGFQITLD